MTEPPFSQLDFFYCFFNFLFFWNITDDWVSVVKNPPASTGDMCSNAWVGKISWRRKWLPSLVFLPGSFTDSLCELCYVLIVQKFAAPTAKNVLCYCWSFYTFTVLLPYTFHTTPGFFLLAYQLHPRLSWKQWRKVFKSISNRTIMKITLPSRKLEQSLTVVFHFPLQNDPLDATKEPGSKVLSSSKMLPTSLLMFC